MFLIQTLLDKFHSLITKLKNKYENDREGN